MLIIDRFEGETAVCESENGFLSLPKGKILGEAKEGDVLIPKGGGEAQKAVAAEKVKTDGINSRPFFR